MNSPPKKVPDALASFTGRKLIVPGGYQPRGLIQAGNVSARWEREARRLFIEFWRTGNQKHLYAFCRHAQAMRTRDRRWK